VWNAQAAAAPGNVSGWNLYFAEQMRGFGANDAPELFLEDGGRLLLTDGGVLLLEGNDD